jgi:phosphatidylserine decarboxylase
LNDPRQRIAPEGRPFIRGGVLAGMVALTFGWSTVALIALTFVLFSLIFFRNPQPCAPARPGIAVSPASGKVILVEEAFEPDFLRTRALHIAIFLNVVDVHVNRAPVRGKVMDLHYHPGRFISATSDKCAEVNERNHVVFECLESGAEGVPVLVTQIAGLIARRIVCHARLEDEFQRGEAFGLIRFGSRTDVWLPLGSKPMVSVGARVRVGESMIAELAQALAADPELETGTETPA